VGGACHQGNINATLFGNFDALRHVPYGRNPPLVQSRVEARDVLIPLIDASVR